MKKKRGFWRGMWEVLKLLGLMSMSPSSLLGILVYRELEKDKQKAQRKNERAKFDYDQEG